MPEELEDKVAVISGGAEGIGFATARLFVKEPSETVSVNTSAFSSYLSGGVTSGSLVMHSQSPEHDAGISFEPAIDLQGF